MFRVLSTVCVVVLLSATSAISQSDLIEPNAGGWKTWVISSGREFRLARIEAALENLDLGNVSGR